MAIMAAFAWYEVRGWVLDGDLVYGLRGWFGFQFLSGLVAPLVPISWAFVIVRVIQGESLVGDRQFWITRPYEWKKLLAAKVLFVLVFVNLSLLIADVVLLAKAGFKPTSYVSGLLWMQLQITLFFILPTAALAAVTASVLQVGLALLVIVLYMVGMAALASQIPSSNFSGPADSLTAVLFLGTCIAVILWQYSRRQTAVSRWLIGGLAVALLLILVATPYRAIVAREYPRLGTGRPPAQLAVLPVKPSVAEATSDQKEGSEVQIHLPLAVSGIADGSIVELSGMMVAIETPGGLQWNSGWVNSGSSLLFPDQKSTQISFTINKDFFKRAQASPVNARIWLALTLFRDVDQRNFVTPHGEFAMPEAGLCSAESVSYRRIHCRAPLRGPTFLLITSDMSASNCPLQEGESPASPGEIARGWQRNSESAPAEFGISPVKIVDLFVSDLSPFANRHNAGICPGTPLTLSRPQLVQRSQTALELRDLRLADYRFSYGRFGSIVVR